MSLETQINTLNTWANECRIILWGLEDDLDWRTISNYDKNQHGGIGWVAEANRAVIADLIEAMQYFVYGYTTSFDYVYWLNVHQGLYNRASPVTWKTIVEAWIANDFEGRAVTIAVIDRMRQILWNEPFNVQWAARPEQEI